MQIGPTSTAPDTGTPDSPAREALRSVAWLREVPRHTLDALSAEAMLHRMPSGSLVFEQAETPSFAQFLLSGSIELLGVSGQAETLIELLQPVDLVIPAAVVSRQPYLMRARVYDEAYLLLVSAETFRWAMANDHALCCAVLGCLSAQFRRQVRAAKNLRLRNAEERVGCYLLSLLRRDEHATSVKLPIDKKEIASQLGMSREAFSRALSGMKTFGLRVAGDTLVVEDAAAAKSRFSLDPLIDGLEPIAPLQGR